MAVNKDKIRKTKGLRTVEIFDLTDNGNPVVILSSKRSISNVSGTSVARRLKKDAEASPWTDKRSGVGFANKSLKKNVSSDPNKELQDFVNIVTR